MGFLLCNMRAVVRHAPGQLPEQQHLEVDAQTAVSAKCGLHVAQCDVDCSVRMEEMTFVITSVTL